MFPMTSVARAGLLLGALGALAMSLSACRSRNEGQQTAGASGSAAPAASVFEAARKLEQSKLSAEQIAQVTNPKGRQPYHGPTATIRGKVKVSGPPSPKRPEIVAQMPADCDQAPASYGVLFREGKERGLADVLVAVTEYDGYVPAARAEVEVVAKGCAFPQRTIVTSFGQQLLIRAGDRRPYAPELLGQRMAAQLFAMPGAEPVFITPEKAGTYVLVDSLRIFARAEVFVLPYSTFAVTDLNGGFEIQGIPAGSVKLDALLPATSGQTSQRLKLEAGEVRDLELTIVYDPESAHPLITVDEGKSKGVPATL